LTPSPHQRKGDNLPDKRVPKVNSIPPFVLLVFLQPRAFLRSLFMPTAGRIRCNGTPDASASSFHLFTSSPVTAKRLVLGCHADTLGLHERLFFFHPPNRNSGLGEPIFRIEGWRNDPPLFASHPFSLFFIPFCRTFFLRRKDSLLACGGEVKIVPKLVPDPLFRIRTSFSLCLPSSPHATKGTFIHRSLPTSRISVPIPTPSQTSSDCANPQAAEPRAFRWTGVPGVSTPKTASVLAARLFAGSLSPRVVVLREPAQFGFPLSLLS